ncbi:Proton-dependent oligopeptide transporter [Parasponia andersonii]|uniref:Proton-dependent oligopeptide transporter n=1 Tax=Parasponia andersonii TaxID=3476 RepID=A0A2P5BP12_PARAD|nr:Proton-dependent oligopeptide transporter [Parasponia andersonii]
MAISSEKTTTTEPVSSKKGGLRTLPFIIANETFEKVASYGLLANMILYLLGDYHFKLTTGANILFLWNALSNFTPIIGAFLSDSFLGRFRVIAIGTVTSLLGILVLVLTAVIRKARPPHCDLMSGEKCESPKLGQRLLLYSSFALMSIGAGGIRPCSMAFGADQIDKPENRENERTLQTFFSWYYASTGISIMIAVTVIVYIQDKVGWAQGFGVSLGLMAFSTLMFFLGNSLYVKVKGNKNLFCGFAHVVSAAWKNRHLSLPPQNNFDGWYYHKGSKLVTPTDKLRFLNKACIIKIPSKDLTHEGIAKDPWSLSTVRQVEELKALLKVLPIWSTGIYIAASISQQSFWINQATHMNTELFTRHFHIPAGSFSVFTLLSLTIWVALYDKLIIPLLSKRNRKRRDHQPQLRPGFTFKQRMAIGLAISCLATSVAAVVEEKRRKYALVNGETMSAMWLVPQHSLVGLAEAFNALGQIEFFFSQFPKSMASIAVALFTLGMGFGNLVGALILKIVDDGTKNYNGGNMSWLPDNPNQGRYDYYYWLLTFLGLVNLLYYFFVSWAYGSCEERKIWDEEEEATEKVLNEEDLSKSNESAVFAA